MSHTYIDSGEFIESVKRIACFALEVISKLMLNKDQRRKKGKNILTILLKSIQYCPVQLLISLTDSASGSSLLIFITTPTFLHFRLEKLGSFLTTPTVLHFWLEKLGKFFAIPIFSTSVLRNYRTSSQLQMWILCLTRFVQSSLT